MGYLQISLYTRSAVLRQLRRQLVRSTILLCPESRFWYCDMLCSNSLMIWPSFQSVGAGGLSGPLLVVPLVWWLPPLTCWACLCVANDISVTVIRFFYTIVIVRQYENDQFSYSARKLIQKDKQFGGILRRHTQINSNFRGMENDRVYFLGSFIGQMGVALTGKNRQHQICKEVGRKLIVIPAFYPNNKFVYVRERFREHPLYCLIADPELKYDLGKTSHTLRGKHYTDPNTDKLDTRFIYGELINQYSEIWTFLLYCGYAHLTAETIHECVLDQKADNCIQKLSIVLVPIVVNVYLTQKAIDDGFELKIRTYNGPTSGTGQPGAYQVQRREEAQLELNKFGRLSLLIMFDLMMLQKDLAALVKSKKQFDTFFKTIARFQNNKQNNWIYHQKHRFATPIKIIIDNQQKRDYYMKSVNKIIQKVHKNVIWGDYGQNLWFNVYYHLDETNYVSMARLLGKMTENVFVQSSKREIVGLIPNELPEDLTQHLAQAQPSKNELEKRQKYHAKYDKYCTLFQQHLDAYVGPDSSLKEIFPMMMMSGEYQTESQQFIIGILRQSVQNFGEFYPTFKKYETKMWKISHKIRQLNFDIERMIQDQEVVADEFQKSHVYKVEDTELKDEEDADEAKNNIFNTVKIKLIQHPTPKQMSSMLQPHQQEALSWMLFREGKISRSQAYHRDDVGQEGSPKKLTASEMKEQREEDDSISQIKDENDIKPSPLWDRIVLLEGTKLYLNVFTGKLQKDFPQAKPTRGGILADEMGLGKTLMALGLIHQDLAISKRDEDRAGTLIIVPKSVIRQWRDEILKHSYPHSISFHEYYEMKSRRLVINIKAFDIVLSTYAILGMDYLDLMTLQGQNSQPQTAGSQQKPQSQEEAQEQVQSNTPVSVDSGSDNEGDLSDDTSTIQYKRGRRDRRPKKQAKRDAMKSAQPRKQDKGLLNPKTPKPQKPRKVRMDIHNLLNIKWTRVILDEAHNIKGRQTNQSKAASMLESHYRWCLTGTPIQNKYDDLFSLINFLRVETFSEYFWWNTYINKENDQERDNILKAIISPILLRRTKQCSDNDEGIVLDLQQREEQIEWIELEDKERQLYQQLFAGTQSLFRRLDQKQQVQNQYVHMFQVIQKLRQLCDHPALVFPKVDDITVNEVEQLVMSLKIFLEKEENMPKRQLTNEFKNEIFKQIQSGEYDVCQICLSEEIVVYSISICGHVYCSECFRNSLQRQSMCPSCRTPLKPEDLMEYQKKRLDFTKSSSISSKMSAILRNVKELKENGEKCLVFTQWIDMITMISRLFEENNILYMVITGKMSANKRQDVINKFEKIDAYTVLLLSLKATSTGLNLTMANNVFIVDPWWNPAIEDQAVGRAHRIGQKRKVMVKRFLCKGTIEEKINLLHDKKRKMAHDVIILSEKERKQADIEQFRYLFEE